ncbi:MAG: hypothetical protein RL120_19140, partial [Gammaproteobacteria bacterium]
MNRIDTSSLHYLPTSLRAFIIAGSYWLLSLPLTVPSGSAAAIIGCVCACLVMDNRSGRMLQYQVRAQFILAICVLLIALGFVLASTLVNTRWFSVLLSPVTAFNVAEFIKWFCLACGLTAVLRLLAQRSSVGGIIEIAFVATAFVITLSAHRNGMIHRPFFIGDYAITRGIDPSIILLML